MALKPDRDVLVWDISKFFASLTYVTNSRAQRGGIVVATGTTPSGAAMDQTVNQVWYIGDPANLTNTPSGAVGMLMADVVNIDLTRQILNPNKSEAQLNDKVPIMRKGWAVTDMIDAGSSAITAEATAYLAGSGYLTADYDATRLAVGKFLSTKDEDGYAKVYIDL